MGTCTRLHHGTSTSHHLTILSVTVSRIDETTDRLCISSIPSQSIRLTSHRLAPLEVQVRTTHPNAEFATRRLCGRLALSNAVGVDDRAQ